jgi:allose kinase
MDIGGTNIRSGFVDRYNKLSDFCVGKTTELFTSGTSEDLCTYIDLLLQDRDPPKAISIGIPSTVDKNNRWVFSTPNIKGFDNIDVASLVENRFGIPAFVSRDVCLSLLYDINSNQLKKEGFIVGFYIGTGTGNAISFNGKIIVGRNGVAGELGHIPVLGRTDTCICGNKGCIELYASGRYLAQIKEQYFPEEDITDIFIRHSDFPLIESFVDNVAAAVATEINILDPEVIILGGGVIMQPGFPREKLEAAVIKYARKPYPAENINFVYTKESNESGVIGAGIFAFQKIGVLS